MKQKHMFSLLDTTFTTVMVVFSNTAPLQKPRSPTPAISSDPRGWQSAPPQEKRYAYKVPLAWKVEFGDRLLVEAQHSGLTIVEVVEVHETAQIDVDANHDYKWAVQKIDFTEYNALRNRELSFNETLRDIERVKQRESVMNDFREHLPADSEARKLFDSAVAALKAPIEGVATPADAPKVD